MDSLDYNEALKDSPKWIRDAWNEYNKLDLKERERTPFLWFVLGKGKGTPPFKASKIDSKYKSRGSNPNVICGNCIFYYVQPIRGLKICSQIRGEVDYDGICRFWKGK